MSSGRSTSRARKGRSKTPANRRALTNVDVVRIKKGGKRFEIACHKNKYADWKNKIEKDLNEVLQTTNIFINVSKGQLARKEELQTCFGIEDEQEICRIILDKGELVISDRERIIQAESTLKEVSDLISSMCIDPSTKRPYPRPVIEQTLKEQNFSLKTKETVKQQALDGIQKLREVMKIDRAYMRIRVSMPHKEAKVAHPKLRHMFVDVEVEDWEVGDLEMVGLIEPGKYSEVEALVHKEAKTHGIVELLSLKILDECDKNKIL